MMNKDGKLAIFWKPICIFHEPYWYFHEFLILFLTEEAYAKWLKPRRSPSEGVRPSPFMLAWVTNVSTSPDLYIEFSTEY